MTITLNGTTGIVSPKVNALDLELDSKNVVDRGSGVNGEWVRLADGTQICTHAQVSSGSGEAFWTYPAVFQGNPRVVMTVLSTALTSLSARTLNPSNTSVGFSVFSASNTRSESFVAAIAIGRWY